MTDTVTIGLLADIHWQPKHADQAQPLLDTVVEQFNDHNTDHVVALGDYVLEGETTTDTKDRIQTVKNTLTKLDAPVTDVLGNHDVVNTQRTVFSNDDPDEYACGTFAITDDITGIYLDTSTPRYPDARGEIGDEQLDFLDTELSNADQAVLFSHHLLYYYELAGNNWFTEHPEAAFAHDKFLANELIEEHNNVLAAFNGHTHLHNFTAYQGVPYFTINAFAEEQPTNKGPNGSYAVLEISDREIRVTSYRHGEHNQTHTIPRTTHKH